ncbi:MAG: hypothetical protein V1787_03885 [Candidatus Micrarchaeota archaeon]
MDVTLRNVDENAFRRFKARCAEKGVTMGEAVSRIMASSPSRAPALPEKTTAHYPGMRDLGDHIRMLHASHRPQKKPSSKRK